ncbi:MAG: hypothetical protein Q9190_003429 [Brigantiaea leucoxantha]
MLSTDRHRHPRVRLTHNAASSTTLLLRAATALSQANPAEAISLYTNVLYATPHGSVVALLNRSLAYVWSGRPELAVVDAYRAAIASNQMRSRNTRFSKDCEYDFQRYLNAERHAVTQEEPWTHSGRRNIISSYPWRLWTTRPLASFLMDDPDASIPDSTFQNLCARLEARAIYRLCGALLECEGGALGDVISLVSDALATCHMSETETHCIYYLGRDAMNRIKELEQSDNKMGRSTADDEHLVLMTKPGKEDRAQVRFASLMKIKVAMVPRVIQEEDKIQPDYGFPPHHRTLSGFVAKFAPKTHPFVVNRSEEQMEPAIELRVSEDVSPEALLLTERNAFHVSTSIPEKIIRDWQPDGERRMIFYCDSCSTAMLLPELVVMDLLTATMNRRQKPAPADYSSDGVFRKPSISASGKNQSPARSAPPPPPLALPDTELSFCSGDHCTIYCCKTCRRLRRPFDTGLHGTRLEEDLRRPVPAASLPPLEHVPPDHPRSLYNHPKAQTIYDLLFLRIYASAMSSNQNPLELVKHVNGGLQQASKKNRHGADGKRRTPSNTSVERMKMPWSFTNNVVRPLQSIQRYHAARNEDHFRFLKFVDGWMINTLLAKIQHSTRITRGSPIVKTFDDEGKYLGRTRINAENWNDAHSVYTQGQAVTHTWVGRLDPLLNMIREADSSKGEVPNVRARFREGVEVFAQGITGVANTSEPCIRSGELLLRAPTSTPRNVSLVSEPDNSGDQPETAKPFPTIFSPETELKEEEGGKEEIFVPPRIKRSTSPPPLEIQPVHKKLHHDQNPEEKSNQGRQKGEEGGVGMNEEEQGEKKEQEDMFRPNTPNQDEEEEEEEEEEKEKEAAREAREKMQARAQADAEEIEKALDDEDWEDDSEDDREPMTEEKMEKRRKKRGEIEEWMKLVIMRGTNDEDEGAGKEEER